MLKRSISIGQYVIEKQCFYAIVKYNQKIIDQVENYLSEHLNEALYDIWDVTRYYFYFNTLYDKH